MVPGLRRASARPAGPDGDRRGELRRVASRGDGAGDPPRPEPPSRPRPAARQPAIPAPVNDMRPTRRHMLQIFAVSGVAALPFVPRAVLAAAPTEKRLVVVLLRGALDGLAAVPPLADPRYRELRGSLALPAVGEDGGCLALD